MKTEINSIQKTLLQFVRKNNDALQTIDFVVGVSRGGLIPAVLIATALDKPLVAAYIDKQDEVYLDRVTWIAGKRVLLVDDIVRTGATFKKMLVLLKSSRVKSVKSYALYCLRDASVQPTWTTVVAKNREMPWDL